MIAYNKVKEKLYKYRHTTENISHVPHINANSTVWTDCDAICKAPTAECLACKAGQTVPEFCKENRNHPGCEGIVLNYQLNVVLRFYETICLILYRGTWRLPLPKSPF